MRIKCRYFASVREALGISEEWINLPENIKTIRDVRYFLMERGAIWKETLASERLKMACQLQIASQEVLITENCEVAFFPPVTGG